MNKKEWVANFEKENGRKPTIDELSAAIKQEAEATEDKSAQKQWATDFEVENGRKPTIEEFNQARATNFSDANNATVEDKTAVASQAVSTPKQTVVAAKPKVPKKKLSKKKKALYITLTTIVVLILGTYFVGSKYYSKEATADRIAKALNTHKTSKYANQVIWYDTSKKVDKSALEPLNLYVAKNSSSKRAVLSGNDVYALKQNGTKFLIFPNYELAVKSVDYTISTNYKDIDLSVNGKKVATSDADEYTKTFTHQVAGLYKFTASGTIKDKKVSSTDKRVLRGGSGSSQSVDLSIKMIDFDVNSNLKSGDFYVGDTKVGTLKDGLLSVKDMPVVGGDSAYVQQKLGSEVVRSEVIDLKDIYDGESVDFDAKGVLTESDASSVLDSMYSSVGSYASSVASDDDSSSSDDSELSAFKNGANNQAYKDYQTMIKNNLKHNAKRNAESITFDSPDVQSVDQTGAKTADVVYHVKIDFYYSSDTDDDDSTSGDVTQTFELKAHMVYDKVKKEWQVDSIDSDQKKIDEKSTVD